MSLHKINHDYYLYFDHDDTKILKEPPFLKVFSPKKVSFKFAKKKTPKNRSSEFQKKQNLQDIYVTENALISVNGQRIWRIRAEGQPEMGVFCEDTGRLAPLGDIEFKEDERCWRLWYRSNQIRRPVGKRFVLDAP